MRTSVCRSCVVMVTGVLPVSLRKANTSQLQKFTLIDVSQVCVTSLRKIVKISTKPWPIIE